MSYLVLARKYRPVGFEAFVGQDAIAETLRNAIKLERVAHAYLFTGPRGVGKTSMARVFAKALNCEKGPTIDPCGKCERCLAIASGQDVDVIEIDGASNRGIDEIRDIRQNARYAASHSRVKIYYIDEVHMLTEPAFNALLKTLEEPPPHVKFIFATTNAAKLPETILSRVQRFDFHRISNADITKKLKEICKAEKLKVPDDVLALVSRRARGSMRDSLSLLDQILSFCGEEPDIDAVSGLLGTLGDDELIQTFNMIRGKDSAGLLKMADELLTRGMDVGEMIQQIIGFTRDLLVARVCGADSDLLDRTSEGATALVALAKQMPPDQLLYIADILQGALRRLKEGQDERVVLEMTLVKLAQSEGLAPLGELLERLAALEDSIAGTPLPAAGSRPVPASTPPSRPSTPYPSRPAPQPAPPPRNNFAAPKPPPEVVREAPVAADVPADLAETWDALKQATKKTIIKMHLPNVEPVSMNEKELFLRETKAGVREKLLEADGLKDLSENLTQILGRPMSVRFGATAAEPAPAAQSPAMAQPKAQPQSQSQKTAASDPNDPITQNVLKRFGGRVVSRE